MLNPYFLMALLYASLAVLAALDSSLATFNLLPWFNGLRWLRVHFITLGVFVEIVCGTLPGLAAARAGLPRPATRWGTWLALNAGLLVLLVGIPLVNGALIVTGGTLVFVAAALLWAQVRALQPAPPALAAWMAPSTGRPFYLAGLGFLLLGIIAGTGLWLGWGDILHMARAKEVHLHANLWGFTSLTLAGLLVDLYPGFAGRALAWPRSIAAIFWMFVVAELGLLAAPWLALDALTMPALVVHHLATAWLVLNVVKPLIGDRAAWTPGMWHIVAGYLWILAPVLAAPFVVMTGAEPPLAAAEAGAPSVLVYGWLLQVLLALAPYRLARAVRPERPARLGGSRWSLLLVHLGGAFFVPAMFVERDQAVLQGIGYACWALALFSAGIPLWRMLVTAHTPADGADDQAPA